MPRKPDTLTLLQARRLLLAGQALLGPQPAGGLSGLIDQLGFVQMDSINVVERAHHLTLGSRMEDYRPEQFDILLEQDRALFEHWTHDAAAIPVRWYPHWKVRFPKSSTRILGNGWWREKIGPNPAPLLAFVLERIRLEGPLRSADFEHARTSVAGWWGWKPQKAALEYLWHVGELTVSRRVNFHKVYDLPERVLPGPHALPAPGPAEHTEWACSTALDRLGAATPRELAAFWSALEPAEAALWCEQAVAEGRIRLLELEAGPAAPARRVYAVLDWKKRLARLEEPPERTELLSPFDPILRDRARALRLFGFDYRFEAFVPEDKREYGYYVLPVLAGEDLVARLDPKLHRDRGVLEIKGLWWEKGQRPGKPQKAALEAAVNRLAARLGATTVEWSRRQATLPR